VIDVIEIASGVAVVAEKYWQARRAAAKVVVEWDPGRNAKLDSDALMQAAMAESAKWGEAQRDEGDVEGAFEKAAEAGVQTLDAVYAGPYLAHAPMEPLNATAHVEKDRVRVWAGTQFQSAVASTAASISGVDVSKVEVYTTYLGGGFGRRGVLDFTSMAVEVSKRM
ncbi:MAG: molybdopterin-dependent oxidoreductase, partial [Xanthomonadales bacterium]|nr:molybdopterin-dependent oxidoreductase [Xanthomonadales bacterium]